MLAMLVISGAAMAQNDTPFVIKKGGNYLAHVKVGENYVLQNAESFNPATCLWYSGPTYNPTGYTHNYYFEDDAHNLRFLAAPLCPNNTLSLSSSLPSVSMLRNTDQVYYFYNWDPESSLNGVPEGGGVAKGHRYYVNTEEECHACGTPPGATWYETNPINHTYQCWEVYWIEYSGSEWKLSSTSSYNITTNGARYRKVTITEHEKEVTAGGLTTLTAPTEMSFGENSALSAPVGTPYNYIPAYTNYVFLESGSTSVHNYWGSTDHGTVTPNPSGDVAIVSKSYQWIISGDGVEYLSFNSGSDVNTSTAESPTLYYRVQNNTGHKTATITVTVTYTDASSNQTTQTLSASVLVKTPCENPAQAATPVVSNVGVTVSWVATAEKYKVDWKKYTDGSYGTPVEVIGASSYTITGLDYQTQYDYRVTAYCGEAYETPPTAPTGTFTTKAEPGLLVNGAIFGGGRMANVGGKSEIVIVNCDSIGGIFGGNDIAGEVQDDDGSTIMLGVNSGDATYGTYGTTSGIIKFGSVYGGGNGYYAYNGESFVAASSDYTEEIVPVGSSVKAMTPAHTVGDVVWTNTGSSSMTLDFPKIVKTTIKVSNDFVKADSIFGGAKNAFLTQGSGNGSTIIIDGGTIMAVFGGNNFGGGQGYGIHYIEVNGTKTNLALDIQNTATTGYGRDFGIRYLFGGGNKVYGSTTDIRINGGQCDNVFGGGNSADVYQANVTVNCALGAYSSNYTFGNTYTNAIPTSYQSGAISIKDDYEWDGKDIYNVRNLYGGNNMEHMASVPTVTLTSGCVGTVYGGGNAGDMLASTAGSIDEDDDNSTPAISFNYSTKVILNSANIIADYLYGGCRMSNVDYSTWVQIQNGHVGTVFGGCNVSGDVGSTRVNPSAASGTEAFQEVQGGTYVEASGGIVYKNLFAGGNGFYHCNNLFHYVSGINYTDENYVGMLVPSHNETYANVRTGATIKGNVYAGGNLAPVGFQDQVAPYFPSFPTDAVGWAVVHIYGGTVEGNVFGGGNMADVYGSNDVLVAGGTITALYGGNDRTGQVAEYSNRVLSPAYSYATDGSTMLVNPGPEVHAYVRVVGNPTIDEVYGGGNGDYDYENGDEVVHQYCDENESGPIQSNTFVDIHIDGGENGGHIGTVYGGGDGVTASGFITVFMNIVEPNPAEDYVNVNTVFGGNNKGDLDIVPNIILLHGQVGTVYGGCNEGAMTAATGVDIGDYTNIGSYVRLRNEYRPNGTGTLVTPTAKVTEAVYGGCRMNGVNRNSLVLVEGGDFTNTLLFGGSDISGTVSGWSRVAVTGGTVGNVYGGGNGGYYYKEATNAYGTYYEVYRDDTEMVQVADSVPNAPICANSGVDIMGGHVGATGTGNNRNIFGGGYGQMTSTTGDVVVNFNGASAEIYGDVYGGSALGSVNTLDHGYSTTVNILNGTLHGDIYGGGLGQAPEAAQGTPGDPGYTPAVPGIAATVNGKVYVNIGSYDSGTGNYSGNATFDNSNVYGCNNLYGSPQDSVFVNIYKTAHGNTPATNAYPSDPQITTVAALQTNALTQTYAINAVYGGGNLAAYTPPLTSSDKRRSATVHVYDCQSNTVRQVFGGGNAADVGTASVSADTYVVIDGGRFHHVIGGGNGDGVGNPGANIFGTANTTVYAGLIDEVYGGANILGSVDSINLIMAHSATCGDEVYGAVFGCANAADYNRSVTTTIECNVGTIGELYGGSNQANIGTSGQNNADVTLNLYGGNHSKVFAGSKGIAGDPGVPANIYGNVTLNLYGGTVVDAFGGSDANGNIAGTITVNVLDHEGTCPLDVTNVYGASNATDYSPDNSLLASPVINVMHIAQADGIRGNVYGGGNNGIVTAITKVNIGYDASTMSNLPSVDYPTSGGFITAPQAYVTGDVFGGGNLAGVKGSEVNINNGTVVHDVYGGNNSNGTVTDDIAVNLLGGTVGQDVFGGGKGNATATSGNILVTVDGSTVGRDVYGGSALGQVNNESTDLTKVWLKRGTITGNLYGGGMGDAGHNTYGQVNGQVEVLVNGGAVSNVFGCNNTNGQPTSSVKVYINETTPSTMNIIGNVYGGGNVAYYEGTPEVYIQNGTISKTSKVFGGGNNITIANKGVGGSDVRMTGGTVLGSIYGGCNTDGDVTGNSVVTITGGTIGATGVGNGGAIFGGGYGENTTVAGDVTVTFGDIEAAPSDSPKLIGDLYGGSALGNVNTNATNTTTVNIYNGEITGPVTTYVDPAQNTYGNVYGGGLGDAGHAALVNGVVYVNIGQTQSPPSGMLRGKATLINCNVYGCNNVNGSPQDEVFVNVYQTAHIQGTNTVDDREFAILQVFGGGNHAHYEPVGGDYSEKRTHVYIHACENTVRYVYGGGNAADAVGVITLVGGGHFDEIFGGGNGAYGLANIGLGGIGLNVMGGRVSYLYAGSNKHGTNLGPNYEAAPITGFIDCGDLVVETFFFGDNEAEHYGDIVHTISCDDAENYHYTRLYAGSRWAIVYGDLKLTVCGGFIQSLFGGSMGYAINQIPAHVRMFPSWQEIHDDLEAHPSGADTLNRKYSYDLRKFMNYVDPDTNPSQYKTNLVGKGGNIELIITGGTIGEAIGGCDELGNVEGKITVIIDDAEDPDCPLRIGNIIGASDYTYYEPCDYDYEGNQVYYDPTGSHGNSVVPTPQVEIIHVDTTGVAYDFNGNGTTGAAETFAGNIYGGANRGDITSNPRVTIGDGTTGNSATKVTIGGDVYGGGNLGHVIGSPDVVVVPTRHNITFDNAPTGGTFTVSYPRGTGVSSGAAIGEGISLRLEATPTAPTSTTGYVFDHWEVTGTGACVNNKTSASTLFTMGSENASVSATFTEKPAHTLTIAGTNGTYTVDGTPYNNTPRYVVETASVTVQVTPAAGFAFDHWVVSGAGASVSSTLSATTVFTMGTMDATLTAYFKEAHLLRLQANNDAYGLFRINGDTTNTIYLAEDNVATVVAIPKPAVANGNGYLFDHWDVSGGGEGYTLSSNTSPSVTFKMGNAPATLTGTFTQVDAHELTMQAVAGGTTGTGGSFKVDGVNYTAPVWIAQGATVPIVATPAVGYRFKRWIDTNSPENGTIADLNAAYTVFTMGTGANRTIQAEFEAIATHRFYFAASPPGGGSITVTDGDGNPVDSGSEIREYTTLNIVASPADGYHFTGWTIDDTGAAAGAQVRDAMNSETTFTIGTANATLTATFEAD